MSPPHRSGRRVNILSLQSHVAYGHVGNSAAVFALQRLGVEVWPIHTVQFSNHTGYATSRGRAFDAAHIRELMQGIARARRAAAAATACCRAISARPRSARRSSTRSAEVKRANPRALYCCDPVIGDVGRGVFVPPEVAEFMRSRAVPAADIVTPNHFELEQLTGRSVPSLADALAAIDAVARAGAAGRAGDLARDRGDAGRRHRSARLRRCRPPSPAHAETADRGERRGRCHRRVVPRALSARRLGRRGDGAGGGVGVRHSQAHRGDWRATKWR